MQIFIFTNFFNKLDVNNYQKKKVFNQSRYLPTWQNSSLEPDPNYSSLLYLHPERWSTLRATVCQDEFAQRLRCYFKNE